MYLDALADILETSTTEKVFVYSADEDAEVYTLLMLGGDGTPIDWDLPGYINARCTAIIRHRNYEDGFNLANEVKDALTFYETTQGNYHFKQVLPREEPRPYRRGDSGILEFSINFSITFIKL